MCYYISLKDKNQELTWFNVANQSLSIISLAKSCLPMRANVAAALAFPMPSKNEKKLVINDFILNFPCENCS